MLGGFYFFGSRKGVTDEKKKDVFGVDIKFSKFNDSM